MTRKALGRGLGALIPGAPTPHEESDDPAAISESSVTPPWQSQVTTPPPHPAQAPPPSAVSPEGVIEIPLERIDPNPKQPRLEFDDEALAELAESIQAQGVIQPILVRPAGDRYQLVAGERRFRASKKLGRATIPAIVRRVSDEELLEVALIENLQREDLNAIEEALAYQELTNKFSYTQEQLSDVIGKSRSHIANMLRLLKLPDSIKEMIVDGRLSAGHARTLVGTPNPEQLAREILSGGLNVRQAEKKASTPKGPPKKITKDADTKALETSVTNSLGMKVEIDHKGSKGTVKIHYKSLEQLDEVMRRLNTFVEVD